MKYIHKLAIFSLLLILSGCESSSFITSSWKAPGVAVKNYKKIIVLGLIREEDRSVREKMEQHIVNDLRELGYDAVCSCEEYNPKFFEGLNERQAIDRLRNSGVDAVLTVTLLNKQKEKHYVPGNINYTPYSVYQNRFYGYYTTVYERIYTKGYYVTNTKYFWESNLYDLGTNMLTYSVQSQSFEPSSTESLSHEYGRMIVKDMVSKKVIGDQKAPTLKAM
jgi:hypothetical protein